MTTELTISREPATRTARQSRLPTLPSVHFHSIRECRDGSLFSLADAIGGGAVSSVFAARHDATARRGGIVVAAAT
jgi:hypothetical protein